MTYFNLLNAKNRNVFRLWLENNHSTETECWLVVKQGCLIGSDIFWYVDAVEKAMCFNRIDSTTKKLDNGTTIQRFTPRSKNSKWSELNKERCRRMERLGCMTDSGRAVLTDMSDDGFVIDTDILAALQSDVDVWTNFQNLPSLYKRIRINTIQIKKNQPDVFAARLNKFIENTKKGVVYGEWNNNGRLL